MVNEDSSPGGGLVVEVPRTGGPQRVVPAFDLVSVKANVVAVKLLMLISWMVAFDDSEFHLTARTIRALGIPNHTRLWLCLQPTKSRG
jgi:hypothetical protein